jgi:DNA-binding XRE family transcriptional regulator
MEPVTVPTGVIAELREIEQERRRVLAALDALDKRRAEVEQRYPPSRRLGDRVRQARTGLGISQRMLARIAGLSPSTISRIERGAFNDLSYGTMRALLIVFGPSVDLYV